MEIEPWPYRLQIGLNSKKFCNIDRLCEHLGIHSENTELIKEGDWGIKGHMELWFQEVAEQHLVIHIQKKHSTHKRKYLEQLEELFIEFDRNECISSYIDIGYSDLS